MKLKFKTWSDYHHQIYRIYHGIIALSLTPFFLVFLELEVADVKEAKVVPQIQTLILLTFIPACFFLCWQVWKGGRFFYTSFPGMSVREKLLEFRRVEVKKYIWMESACVITLCGLWLTAHYFFVIAYFVVLAQFSFLRPSEDRIIRNMRLTKEERRELHEGIN